MGSKTPDLTGVQFGRWQVLRRDGSTGDAAGNAVWLCKCDCGTTRRVIGRELRRGRSKSCGCLNRDFAPALAIERNRKRQIQRGAIVPEWSDPFDDALPGWLLA